MNLACALDRSAETLPDQTFLITDARHYSYKEIHQQVCRLAGALKTKGVQPGDRVVISFANTPEFVVAYFAVLKAGGIVVTNNTMNKRYEVAHNLNNTQAVGWLSTRKYAVPLYDAWEDLTMKPFVLTSDGATEKSEAWEEVFAQEKDDFETVSKNEDDLAMLVFTAAHQGGYARAVMLSHHNLFYNATESAKEYGLDSNSIHVGVLPFYHTYGCTGSFVCVAIAGAQVSLFPRFVPQDVARRISQERATHLSGVPTIFAALCLLDDVNPVALSPIIQITTCGMAIDQQILQGFERKFGKRLREGYGLTECSPTVCYMRQEGPYRHGTVGPPMPGVFVEAMDDAGNILPRGTTGEIVVKGPTVCKGFWEDPAFTKAHFVGDWLRTGDLGFVEDDDFATLTGLKKRMFLTGGFNIYPEEVERLMGYTDLFESVRFEGVPDMLQGQTVKAYVKLKPGVQAKERELRNACSKVMAIYKVPRAFVVE